MFSFSIALFGVWTTKPRMNATPLLALDSTVAMIHSILERICKSCLPRVKSGKVSLVVAHVLVLLCVCLSHSLLNRMLCVARALCFFFRTITSSACRLLSFLGVQGKTAEEIRKTFNIVNDFTPEEEAQVREENKWCEDA